MVDSIAAILASGVLLGLLLLILGVLALVLLRMTGRRVSRSAMRRVARMEVVFGVIALAYVIVGADYGGGITWIVALLQGPVFVYLGWWTLRELSALDKRDPVGA